MSKWDRYWCTCPTPVHRDHPCFQGFITFSEQIKLRLKSQPRTNFFILSGCKMTTRLMYILQRVVHKTQKPAPLNDACRTLDSNKMNNPSTSKQWVVLYQVWNVNFIKYSVHQIHTTCRMFVYARFLLNLMVCCSCATVIWAMSSLTCMLPVNDN